MNATEQTKTPVNSPSRQPSIKVLAALILTPIIGVIGYGFLLSGGLYGPMFPAALPGLGVNLVSNRRSYLNGVLAALVGGASTLFAEWKHLPFVTDKSLGFFLNNISELSSRTLILMAIGTGASFFLGTSFFKPNQA